MPKKPTLKVMGSNSNDQSKGGKIPKRIESTMGVRFRALVEQVPAIIYTDSADEIYHTLYISPQLKTITGYDPEEWIADVDLWNRMILPEDRERVMEEYTRTYAANEPSLSEYRIKTRDGRIIWVRDETRLVRDKKGKPLFWQGVMVDITALKQAEQALRHSRDLLDLTGQMAKVGGWELDMETQTLIWTEEVYRIHEIDPGTRLDVTEAINFYSPEAQPVIAAAVQVGIDSGTPWDLELPLITAQGQRIWVRAQGAAECRGGKTVCLHGAFQDITERKQAERLREALYTISQAAVTESLEDLYLSIHRALGNLMPVDNFYIALYDSEADLLSFPYCVDQHDEFSPPRKPRHGLTEYVLRTGCPLLVDRQSFTQLVQQGEVELVGVDSLDWLGVPLKMGEEIFGVLAVQSYTERVRFSQAEMKMLEFVSSQMTPVIERKLTQQRIADALEFNFALIDVSTMGIIAYDSSGQCILANEAIARILGATRVQVLRQNYNNIEWWKNSGLLESAHETAASGNETRREIHSMSSFGKEIWLDCRFTYLFSNGKSHLLLTVDDISIPKQAEVALQAYAAKLEQNNRDLQDLAIERKQAEIVLRASEAKYRTLVDTSPDGISMSDLEGKLLLCNKQTARLHGYENPEAMCGLNVLELIAPEYRQLVVQNAQKILEEGNVTNIEYIMLRKDGSRFPAELSAALICDKDGAPANFISITRDITERIQAIEAEKRLIEYKEEFIATLSHDLRTPLFSLVGYLDLLRNGKVNDSDVRNEFLTRASLDVDRLKVLVNELLDTSRLENNFLVLNWEEVDLGAVIMQELESFREQAKARRISLKSAPWNTTLIAEMDPSRMQRVLANLVENAIKFSYEGGDILVTGESRNGTITINVIDEGCGISTDDCSKVFDKFYQVSHTLKQNKYGTGLGLYISKQIVEAHGGSLTVKSQLGVGSTFTVAIPVKKSR
jgi:PAS domain S-box-containing protein